MEAVREDLNVEIVDYYDKQHPEEPVISTIGEDSHVTIISRDSRFPKDATHIVIPIKITMKRYFEIPADEPEILEQEVRDSGDVWAGEIKGLAPIREILQNTSEEFLLHPIVEDREKLYASASSEDDNNNNPNTYVEHYKFHPKNGGSCNYWNCPVHFGNFRKLPWEKQWVLLGEPLSNRKVIKMGRLRRMKRLTDYNKLLLMSLQVTDSLDRMDKPNLDDYYDEMQ